MLLMVNLICAIFKYCLILTIVRLATTAFNWEFGISRNYLRLLELLFYLGQKRIERAESRNKLPRSDSSDDDDGGGGRCCQDGAEIAQHLERESLSGKSACPETSSGGEGADEGAPTMRRDHEAENQPQRNRRSGVVTTKQKLRRISTPDGPPVFLLDAYEDDQDDFDTGHHCSNHEFHEFHLVDACKLVVRGLSAIIDDEVTKRFTPEALKTWNLLTRTNAKNYQFMSRSLGLYWILGVVIRYSILLPLRIMFTVAGFLWLTSTMTILGLLVPQPLRHSLYCFTSLMSFRMLSCGLTSRLTFHNRQYRAQRGEICVANHTSPLDVVILACDNCYSLVGQRHGGLIGILEAALSRATNHVWFDRGEMRDRQLVSHRLKEYVEAKSNLPVLIFPEGTCINNSAVMLFRKGSFECSDRVCPVAIKYDSRFGDPFWNSSKHSYIQYLLLMMSSWAIKCEVWYLPPMERRQGESSAEFAGRVKAEIARQGGLVDLNWDGQLKRTAPKEQWKFQQQEDYVRRLKLE